MSEDRRKEAEERIAVAQARRKQQAAADSEALELARLEREAEDAEALADAEATHGPAGKAINIVRAANGRMVLVKRPAYTQAQKFHDSDKFTLAAKDKLGRPNVIYPSRDEYAAMAADDASLVVAVADAAADLAGFGRTEIESKS